MFCIPPIWNWWKVFRIKSAFHFAYTQLSKYCRSVFKLSSFPNELSPKGIFDYLKPFSSTIALKPASVIIFMRFTEVFLKWLKLQFFIRFFWEICNFRRMYVKMTVKSSFIAFSSFCCFLLVNYICTINSFIITAQTDKIWVLGQFKIFAKFILSSPEKHFSCCFDDFYSFQPFCEPFHKFFCRQLFLSRISEKLKGGQDFKFFS